MGNIRINKKIRTDALEKLNKLKENNQIMNRSYEAIKKSIENSRIDVVKKLKINFDIVIKTKSIEKITKGKLKDLVVNIKQEKLKKIASIVPYIKKKYEDIALVKAFNKNRDTITIKDMNVAKLKRIFTNIDTNNKMYGVLLKAGYKFYILNTSNIINLMLNVDKFYVNETIQEGSDKDIIQSINSLDEVIIRSFLKKKDLNVGGFFNHYNKTEIDLTDFQIYNSKQDGYTDNCFICALKNSPSDLTTQELNSIKLMCYGLFVPCNKIKDVCTKFNLSISVQKIVDRNISHNNKIKYGTGDRVINIGLIDKHYFAIKEIPYTLYSVKNYFDIKNIKDYNRIINAAGIKSLVRYTNSFQAIKYIFENKEKFLIPMPYSDLLDTQYHEVKNEITDLNYMEQDIQPNKVYVKKIEGNKITTYNYGKQVQSDFKIVYFDCECSTDGINHQAYLVCNSLTKTTYGPDCCRYMLLDICNQLDEDTTLILIAHNAGYDYRFLLRFLVLEAEVTSGKRLLQATGKFYYDKGKFIKIIIKDSLSICSMSLDTWSLSMKTESEKQFLPYDLYSQQNVDRKFIDFETCKNACIYENYKQSQCDGEVQLEKNGLAFYDKFLDNATKWGCIVNNKINILAYSKFYCDMDVRVLKECYEKMRALCLDTFDIDILDCMSSSQLAQRFMEVNGVFTDVNMLSSTPREFMMRCIEGGRVMIADNVKNKIELRVADFDAVSLYPSAMERLGGYLKGKPKILPSNVTYNMLKNYTGYFTEIIIRSIKINRSFSLMSNINDKGIRMFDNELPKRMFVCKQKLEDLIEFQGITFDIVRGYYYDEGRNEKLNEVIKFAFNERLKLKDQDNPLQECYKLIMNGAYGKTLQSAFDTKVVFIYGENKLDDYISKNYNTIDSYTEFSKPDDDYRKFRVTLIKPINSAFNNVPCGVEVLGMSKRIMNEVMCLAEDNDMKVYYTDTDSIHIEDKHIIPLSLMYEEKYERKLIGKAMGQFHTDFKSKIIKKNIMAVKSIFLGKKCYIDVLEGIDDDGKIVQDYHIRMKGVNSAAIKYYCLHNNINPYQLYEKLYKNECIELDLTAGGNKCSFEFNKNYTISSNASFIREVCFEIDPDKKKKLKKLKKN